MTTAMTVRGRVRAGRLVVDEPVDLPDGTEVELIVAESGDEPDEASVEAAGLAEALRRSDAIDRGEAELLSVEELFRRVDKRLSR